MIGGSRSPLGQPGALRYMIISKLEWSKASSSERQLEDVAGILRVRAENLDLSYIRHWVDELGLDAQWQRARDLSTR